VLSVLTSSPGKEMKKVRRKIIISIPGMHGIVDFPRVDELIESKNRATGSSLKKLGVSLPDDEAKALALDLFYHERFDDNGLGKKFSEVFVIGTYKVFQLRRGTRHSESNLVIWQLSSSFIPSDRIARFMPSPE
jgi:hypothetical protein